MVQKRSGRKWTEAADARADKKAGLKPGSKTDNALDKQRGVSTRTPKGKA
jgi:hypothetical protein